MRYFSEVFINDPNKGKVRELLSILSDIEAAWQNKVIQNISVLIMTRS